MSEQQSLALPLAGAIADLRDKLAKEGHPVAGEIVCACCGTRYRRGQWKCCAPNGQQGWFQKWHEGCPSADAAEGPGKRKCPRHCRCKRDINGVILEEPVPAATKEQIDALRSRPPSPKRTSSLPMDPKDLKDPFLESEWPDEQQATGKSDKPRKAIRKPDSEIPF